MRWLLALLVACSGTMPSATPIVHREPPADAAVAVVDAAVIVDVAPSTAPVVGLALGELHSCALHADGLVSCWGDNSSGQLGDGTLIERDDPVRARIADVVELAAHEQATCARKRDRSVWCWRAGSPVAVKVASDATQIGGACIVLATGRIACWDDESTKLVVVTGIDDAVVVASGGRGRDTEGACAVRATGEIACWSTPDAVRTVPGISDAVGVAMGWDFACARRKGGAITCWGSNFRGELGRGTVQRNVSMHRAPLLGPAPVVGIDDAIELVAGSGHACVRRKNQRVACWGTLGEGDAIRTRPVDLAFDAGLLASGARHLCAVADGKLACWGHNEHGQLGIGWSGIRKQPTRVPGIDDAVAVHAAHEVTCARRRTGAVACWGHGDARPRDVAGLANVEQVAGISPCMRDRNGAVACIEDGAVKRIAIGGRAIDLANEVRFGCVVLAGGSVRCWGNNEYGMFGNGTTTTQQAELPPQPAASGIANAVAIAVGPFHTCVIRATGEVACWGDRIDDSTLGKSAVLPEPVGGISDAKQLALGTEFTCVLRATGRVTCWGGNDRGELGNGTSDPFGPPGDVKGLTDAVQLSGRGESLCARRSTGTLVCWGRNHEGQLGDGGARDPGEHTGGRSTPFAVPNLTDVVDVSVGGDHSCAVLADGGVACWGTALHGEVGTVVSGYTKTPTAVIWR